MTRPLIVCWCDDPICREKGCQVAPRREVKSRWPLVVGVISTIVIGVYFAVYVASMG